MIKTKKNFDCVLLKNEIQTGLQKEYHALSDDARAKVIDKKLQTSQSPAAIFWRELCNIQNVSNVAEDQEKYGD